MSDRITILNRADDLNKSPQFNAYSKVVIHVDDETDITVGNDTGRTLEITNPFGTTEMAQQILAKLNGFSYQPYEATGALLDPAAEVGDAVAVKDLYGGLYTRERVFGRLMKANIAAPHDEEINHEYKFEKPQEREVKRQFKDVRATLAIQADSIDAKVSKTGGNSNNTFAWSLDADGFYIHNGEITSQVKQEKSALFTFTSSGLAIKGKITATSGYIGNGANGFTISDTAISNGMTALDDTKHNGIYISTSGIALGKGAFKVTKSGTISAKDMTLTGTLKVGDKTIEANNLRLGAERCNSGYQGWDGAKNWTDDNGKYCVGGAGWGYDFGSMDKAANQFPINASSFRYRGSQLMPQTISILDGNGNIRTFYGVMMSV